MNNRLAGGQTVTVLAGAPRQLLLVGIGAIPGLVWILGGSNALGPLFSILLVAAVAVGRSQGERLATALGYYATGSWPIIGAVTEYWGAAHPWIGFAAWAACSLALAIPWAWAANWPGLIFALAATALPPLGVIGWLSPITAAGMLFPGLGWAGLVLTIGTMVMVHLSIQKRARPCAGTPQSLLILAVIGAISANLLAVPQPAPSGWVGMQTKVRPSRGSVLRDIQNDQTVLAAGLAQGKGARVVIFPEAILDNWWPGTRQQLARAVPPGQIWLIGSQAGNQDAVVMVSNSHAARRPVTAAAGLLLGGDWQPWNARTLRPALAQPMFTVEGKRAWAALCVEQVLPWTWLEALWQRPDAVLAMSNDWWATSSSAAPGIQAASTKAWARLMGVPVVWALNR